MISARETAHFCEKKNACEMKSSYQQSVLKLMNDWKKEKKREEEEEEQ